MRPTFSDVKETGSDAFLHTPLGRAARLEALEERKELEKEIHAYADDLKARSEFPETLPNRPFDLDTLERRSPESNRVKREEFDDLKTDLKRQWETATGMAWPKYQEDVYSASGNLIRKAGNDYDAHHIHPLSLGGDNVANNITPLHASQHFDRQGIHAPDSPYSKMVQRLEDNDL